MQFIDYEWVKSLFHLYHGYCLDIPGGMNTNSPHCHGGRKSDNILQSLQPLGIEQNSQQILWIVIKTIVYLLLHVGFKIPEGYGET